MKKLIEMTFTKIRIDNILIIAKLSVDISWTDIGRGQVCHPTQRIPPIGWQHLLPRTTWQLGRINLTYRQSNTIHMLQKQKKKKSRTERIELINEPSTLQEKNTREFSPWMFYNVFYETLHRGGFIHSCNMDFALKVRYLFYFILLLFLFIYPIYFFLNKCFTGENTHKLKFFRVGKNAVFHWKDV